MVFRTWVDRCSASQRALGWANCKGGGLAGGLQPSASLQNRTFPEGSSCCKKSKSRTLRVSTEQPCFLAVANSKASFNTRRRWSLLHPCSRASVPDRIPASRHISESVASVRWLGRRSITATTCSMIPRVCACAGSSRPQVAASSASVTGECHASAARSMASPLRGKRFWRMSI